MTLVPGFKAFSDAARGPLSLLRSEEAYGIVLMESGQRYRVRRRELNDAVMQLLLCCCATCRNVGGCRGAVSAVFWELEDDCGMRLEAHCRLHKCRLHWLHQLL